MKCWIIIMYKMFIKTKVFTFINKIRIMFKKKYLLLFILYIYNYIVTILICPMLHIGTLKHLYIYYLKTVSIKFLRTTFPVCRIGKTGTSWSRSSLIRVSFIGKGSFAFINMLCKIAVAIIVARVVCTWVRLPTDNTGNLRFQTPNVRLMTFLVPIWAL